MDWWRACTKARTRLPNIYHIPMHKWQSLKLMWLLFVQIQIFEGDETTRRRSKRNGDDAAMRLLGQSEFDVSMHWNGVCLKIYIMAHIFETTQPKVLKVHTTYIHISAVMPCSNWIWIECVLVGSWRWDHIHTHTQTNAPFFGRSYDIFTASLLLKWRTIFLSLYSYFGLYRLSLPLSLWRCVIVFWFSYFFCLSKSTLLHIICPHSPFNEQPMCINR